MLGPPKTRDLDRPVLVSVESSVPKDHFYRHLHRILDLSVVRDLVADRYASGGRPSVDPEVFFRLHLIMFFAGRLAT
jgi:transposase